MDTMGYITSVFLCSCKNETTYVSTSVWCGFKPNRASYCQKFIQVMKADKELYNLLLILLYCRRFSKFMVFG